MKFSNQFNELILSGDKTLTVRASVHGELFVIGNIVFKGEHIFSMTVSYFFTALKNNDLSYSKLGFSSLGVCLNFYADYVLKKNLDYDCFIYLHYIKKMDV